MMSVTASKGLIFLCIGFCFNAYALILSHSLASSKFYSPNFPSAVSCMLWITEWSLAEIEATLTQFGGRFDGAAGAVRSVAARTCDLLPTVVRVAELLHPTLDLSERYERLRTRLEIGVPSVTVD
jgi:hypothetical protein